MGSLLHAVLVLLVARLGPAAPEGGLQCRVEGASPCLEDAHLTDGVGDTLGMTRDQLTRTEPTEVRVHAARMEGGWEAVVTASVAGHSEIRRNLEITNPSCEALRDAVVLVTALLLEQLWREERTIRTPVPVVPEPEPVPSPIPRTQPPMPPRRVETRPAPRAAHGPARGWGVETALLALLSAGDLPGLAGGIGLRAGWEAPKVLALFIQANAWPRRVTTDVADRGARFAAYEILFAVCGRVLVRPTWDLAACADGQVGINHVAGVGLAEPLQAVRPRAGLGASMLARFRLAGPLWIVGWLGASAPLVRDTFGYDDAGGRFVAIHRPFPVGLVAGVGLSLRGRLASDRRRSR